MESEAVRNVGTEETSAFRPPGNVEIPSKPLAGLLAARAKPVLFALLFACCLSGTVSDADCRRASGGRRGFAALDSNRMLRQPGSRGGGLLPANGFSQLLLSSAPVHALSLLLLRQPVTSVNSATGTGGPALDRQFLVAGVASTAVGWVKRDPTVCRSLHFPLYLVLWPSIPTDSVPLPGAPMPYISIRGTDN